MIRDYNDCPLSKRNGMYGGQAGDKEGILVNGENWIVKYPKNTKNMRNVAIPYTTASLSEYIGSNIYDILGIDVHKTELGIRNDKLVVVCKDFCKNIGDLRELRTIKNTYNKELNEKLETSLVSTSDSHLIDIEDILIHLDYNPILKNVPYVKERFWEQVIVDVLINNNDRNNGNWGVLYDERRDYYELAPVYDNGAAFSNKISDDKMEEILNNPIKMANSADNSITIYSLNGKTLFAKNLTLIENKDFYETAASLIPYIYSKLDEIANFINRIPEEYEGIPVCSAIKKEFYIQNLDYRFDNFLVPIYDKAVEMGLASEKDFDNMYSKDIED